MAKKINAILNLEVPAGKAQPAPPLGPMLGANGVNIGAFIQDFNGQTMDYMKQFSGADVKIRCKLFVYADRTYSLEIIGPKTGDLLKWKAKIKKGSGEPNKVEVATLTKADLAEVAEIQMKTLNTAKPESVLKTLEGTCKNMGIKVVA